MLFIFLLNIFNIFLIYFLIYIFCIIFSIKIYLNIINFFSKNYKIIETLLVNYL